MHLFRKSALLFLLLGITSAYAQVTRFIVSEAGGSDPLGTTLIQAGLEKAIRVVAVDAAGDVVTTYAHDVTVTLPEPTVSDGRHASVLIPASSFVDGVADNIALPTIHAGTNNRRVSVTDGNIATYNANVDSSGLPALFSIAPAGFSVGQAGSGWANPFSLGMIGSQFSNISPLGNYVLAVGRSFPARVAALNADGTIASGYSGTAILSSSAFSTPRTVTISSNGFSDTVSLTFDNPGTDQTITAYSRLGFNFFDASAITDGSDTIDLFFPHGLRTGDAVLYSTSGETEVDGLVDQTIYYVIVEDEQRVKLAATPTDATDGTAITFATAGTGFQFLNPVAAPLIPEEAEAFDVGTFVATPGIDNPEDIEIEPNAAPNPGESIFVSFTVKSQEQDVPDDAPQPEVDSGTDEGTYHVVTLFNNARRSIAISFLVLTDRATAASDAEDGTPGGFSFVIPTYFPPGAYTLRISAGGIDSRNTNTDTAITIEGLPDLAIERLDYAPGVYEAGEALRFDMVWSNRVYSGNNNYTNALAPGNTLYRVELHLSSNDIFGDADDFLVWVAYAAGRYSEYSTESSFGDLLPGDSVSLQSEFKLPENFAGSYYLLAKVNSSGGAPDFSSGYTEEIGPTPPSILEDGNNIVLANETQKLTIVPRTAPETTLVSADEAGDLVVGDSDYAVISSDGAYVCFQSTANFPGSNGLNQIYRKDLASGQVVLVSAASSGVSANGPSTRPAVSADGRYVVFESTASNLDPSDRNGVSDIYLRDMQVGVTLRLSVNGITEANSGVFKPSISADGRFVVFASRATNLLAGTSLGYSQIYLLDRGDPVVNGGFDVATAISLISSTAGVAGNGASANARISADGAYVVFSTRARNLLSDTTNPFAQVVRWERSTGTLLPISVGDGALADGDADFPAIDADGDHIVFVSRALNLTPGTADTYANGAPNIFRATVLDGVVQSPLLRINGYGGEEPDVITLGVSSPDLGAFEPVISADGNLVAFTSESTNFVSPLMVHHLDRTVYPSTNIINYADENYVADVYLADLSDPLAPIVQRASVSSFGYEATARTVGTSLTLRVPSSRSPAISADGRYVLFTSDAEGHSGLLFGDTNFEYVDGNDSRDIYLFDRKTSLNTPSNLPTVSLQVPATLTVTSGSQVTLLADASAPSRGIASVEFYANNLLVGASTSPVSSASGAFGVIWTAPSLGNGNTLGRLYSIVAVAVDTSGVRSLISNTSKITVIPATLSPLPTVTITGPSFVDQIRAGSSVRLDALVTDADRNFGGVEFYVNSTLVGIGTQALATTQIPGAFVSDPTERAFSFNWTNAGVGTYVLTAVARDTSGNRVSSAPVVIDVLPLINSGVPSITLTTPASNVSLTLGETLRLVASASDPAGTLERVDFYANGTLMSQDTSAPYEGAFVTIEASSVGTYEIYAVAVDSDGNQSISNSILATVTTRITPVVGGGNNDLFVYQVLLDGEQQHLELNPGDPIKYEVAFGRNVGTHGAQTWRINVYLSTDGDPANQDNFLLDFIDGSYPGPEAIGRFEHEVLTDQLPRNFTGTYFLIAQVVVMAGAADPNPSNNQPSVFTTGTSRITIRPADSPTVSRVSVDAPGNEPDLAETNEDTDGNNANEFSESGSISGDGRYVVFQSEAPDLVLSPRVPTGVSQIYLRDTLTNQTTLISQLGGVAGNAESKYAVISSGGAVEGGATRYFIAYQSAATNLVGGAGNVDTNGKTDIFLYDLAAGTTRRISLPSGAAPGSQANNGSFLPSISANGEYVVFESDATNLLPSTALIKDTNGQRDIYLYSRLANTVSAISTTASGVFGSGASTQAQISADGSTIVFRSFGRNLGASALPNGYTRSVIYAKTRATGAIAPISILREALGADTRTYAPFNEDAFDPAVSADGRYVAFASRSAVVPAYPGSPTRNLAKVSQVYVVNRQADDSAGVNTALFDLAGNVSLTLVSAAVDPVTGLTTFGEDESLAPVINGDGRYIGYRSEAADLLPVDLVRSDGISFRSNTIRFYADQNNTSDVYLRDTGIVSYVVTSGGSGYPASEGIPFAVTTGGGVGATALAIVEDGVITRVDVLTAGSGYNSAPAAISIPGGAVEAIVTPVFLTSSERVSVSHFGMQTIGIIGSTTVPSTRDLAISQDGRFLVFTSDAHNTSGFVFGKSNRQPLDTNSKRDVFLVDRRTSSLTNSVVGAAPIVQVVVNLPLDEDGEEQTTLTTGSSILVQATAFDTADVANVASNPTEVAGSIQDLKLYANGRLVAFTSSTALGLQQADGSAVFTVPSTPGPLELHAVAVDSNGNVAFSNRVTLTVVAGAGPNFTSLTLTSTGAARRGQVANFTVTGVHPTGTISSVLFLANGFPFVSSETAPNPVTSAPFSTSRTYDVAGTFTFSALVTDSFGNTAVTNVITETVLNNNPPTVRVTYPFADSNVTLGTAITLEAEAIAPDAGDIITAVSFYANGVRVTPSNDEEDEDLPRATQVAGTNRWRFTWTPTVAGTYRITAEAVSRGGVQNSVGNNPLVATSAGVSIEVKTIASTEASSAIGLAYQLVFDREPTQAEIVAAVAKFGEDVTTVELITDLLVSSTYRDGEAELLLYHLAVFGRYPTPTEFAALRTLVAAGGEGEAAATDVEIINSMLTSSAYSTLYGDIDDLSVVSTSQYELIRAFALRTYANINGKAITGTSASVLAQNFFSSIAGYRRGTVLVPGTTPAATLVNYIASIYKAGKNTTLLAKLRVAGALLFIENEEPDRASVDTLAPYPLVAVVQQLLSGEIFYVAGSFVEIPTATGDEPVGTTFYVSGLPKGLVIDKNTGVITGQLPASIKIYSFKVWTQSSTGVRSAVSQRLLVAGALSSKFAGGVDAILHDESGDVVGKVSYKVSTSASYTGKLMYRDGKTYSFKGVLGVQGTDPETATAVGVNSALIKRASPLLPLELGIAYAEDGAVTLWVAEGAGTDPVATATEEDVIKTTTYTKSAPAPWRGVTKVNLVTEGDLFPAGSGSGTLSVATTGVLSVRIRGGDNALITGTANSSATSQYRFYTRPYSKKPAGYFAGSLTLSDEETPATVDFPETDFTWFRPAGLAPYPEGFGPISVSLELTE